MTDNEIGERIDIMIRGELEARESWRKDTEGEIGGRGNVEQEGDQ